jgi:hypothetical protein
MNKISVVIPLYNKSKYIVRALNSIYQQTKHVDEIIVVNDGSSDNGAEVVKGKFPDVILIEQKNQGVSVARNTGIAHAKNEFVAFLDADDYWLPNFIENIYYLIELAPAAGMFCTHYGFKMATEICSAKIKEVPSTPGFIDDIFAACINADLPITASSVCIRRELLLQISGFPVGMKMGEDQVVWAKIACLSQVMYHPETSVHYDLSIEGSACDVNQVLEPAPQLTTYQNMLNNNLVPDYLVKSLMSLMSLTVISCAKNNLLLNHRYKARELLLHHPCLIWDQYRICGLLATYLPKPLLNFVIKLMRGNR